MGKTFLKSIGYPENFISGFLALFIGFLQLFVFGKICLPKLFKSEYFIQNYTIDTLRKPLKWFGAFWASISFASDLHLDFEFVYNQTGRFTIKTIVF